ncbi:MAG: hypothetical protein ACM37W_26270 [Actinomycetota bacterium]
MKIAHTLLPIPKIIDSSLAKFRETVTAVWQVLATILTSNNQLRIWQTRDRFGNTWWHACDPTTGRSACVATEDELRLWVEQRYYH